MSKRAFIIVLDGVGVGALPDADNYQDVGSHTLLHTAEAVGGLDTPTLQIMGLGHIIPVPGIRAVPNPVAAFGKMAEQSIGKDTTSGHWEISGLINHQTFPTYPHGFPPEIVQQFSTEIGRGILGNIPASGTDIIDELGEKHIQTGKPIVYTSADSVFQIAAHEEIIPLKKLYRMCLIARAILSGKHAVGRVIARPFLGQPGAFIRTRNRHDFSLPPSGPTVLSLLQAAGKKVIGVGKISDIFAGVGLTESRPTQSNQHGMEVIIDAAKEPFDGLLFANLIDTDMLYGHRRDPKGFATAIEAFDQQLKLLLPLLSNHDLLIITADHGNDPTFQGSDHTREYVPLLALGAGLKPGSNLGTRETFADVGATVLHFFNLAGKIDGCSFLPIPDINGRTARRG